MIPYPHPENAAQFVENLKVANYRGENGQFLVFCPADLFVFIELVYGKNKQVKLADGWTGHDLFDDGIYQCFLIWEQLYIQIFDAETLKEVHLSRQSWLKYIAKERTKHERT